MTWHKQRIYSITMSHSSKPVVVSAFTKNAAINYALRQHPKSLIVRIEVEA